VIKLAIEPKRGCGYRKVGGLYLVGSGITLPCDRLPYLLEVCPTCGAGVKFSQGFRWLDIATFLGEHKDCKCVGVCPVCHPTQWSEKHGLMWVGRHFYTPESFVEEATRLGISKRISRIPKELVLGQTWILLAHKEAGEKLVENVNTKWPAIFYAFRPQKIEMIVTQSQSKDGEFMQKLNEKNLTPVVVPDNDADHIKTKKGELVDKK
jgi:hypothetical protein